MHSLSWFRPELKCSVSRAKCFSTRTVADPVTQIMFSTSFSSGFLTKYIGLHFCQSIFLDCCLRVRFENAIYTHPLTVYAMTNSVIIIRPDDAGDARILSVRPNEPTFSSDTESTSADYQVPIARPSPVVRRALPPDKTPKTNASYSNQQSLLLLSPVYTNLNEMRELLQKQCRGLKGHAYCSPNKRAVMSPM